jgi:hypothetical protein
VLTNPLIAKQRITDAQNARANVAKKRLEESAANRQSYEKFYNQLALLSGGSIALSITYMGFLKTITNQPLHLKLLVASWVTMFICLVCATYYSFFNTSHLHYGRSREYAQRVKEEHETIADEVPNVRVVGVDTPEELSSYVKELRETAAARGQDVSWNQRKEKLHEFMFRACAVTARTSFVLGIALLLSFAVANISVSTKVPDNKQETTTNAAPAKAVTASKDKVVEIPCVGIVTFPASISDDDVNAACKVLFDREEEARKKRRISPCKLP